MKSLGIDIETYSDAELKKTGVYKYAQHHSFRIQLFSYSVDRGAVQLVDLERGEQVPQHIIDAILDRQVLKTAWNAAFERACIAAELKIRVGSAGWECTMARASMCGLPLSLGTAAKVLKLPIEKEAEGKALIQYFSKPCKPTKRNGMRTRNAPFADPEGAVREVMHTLKPAELKAFAEYVVETNEKWEDYRRYNMRDVEVEQLISEKLSFFQISDFEKRLWRLDQVINDRGIMIDRRFVNNAIAFDQINRARLYEEAIGITGVQNPNSRTQLIKWLNEEMPLYFVDRLRKADLPRILELSEGQLNEKVIRRIIEIRMELSKTSLKKYPVMEYMACADSRARGLLQYYGANRTGRFAGRGIQVQNLTKNFLKDIDLARQLVRSGDLATFQMIYAFTDTLSQLIRTAFIAQAGHRFVIADFSSIEAVVIAWLAGEQWRLEVFRTHGKIYEASASAMFRVPLESITYVDEDGNVQKGVNYHLRALGKIAELALGFGGGPNALTNMDAKKELSDDDKPGIVAAWRTASPMIAKLWRDVEYSAITAVRSPGAVVRLVTGGGVKLQFVVRKNILNIVLPSGRPLCYVRPRLKPGKYGKDYIEYEGVDQTKKIWCRLDTYGGKLVENIVQAIARDCLVEGLMRLNTAQYRIVMHVHDEAVAEMPEGTGSVAEMCQIMCEPIAWAEGLPIKAAGYETNYYKKD